MLLPTYKQSRIAVMPPFMPRGRLSFGSSSGFDPTSVKFLSCPPDGILSTAVRAWIPVYSVEGCEHAAATRRAMGAASSHLPKRDERAVSAIWPPPYSCPPEPDGLRDGREWRQDRHSLLRQVRSCTARRARTQR